MIVSSIFRKEFIKIPLVSDNKFSAIDELLNLLPDKYNKEDIRQYIIERENKMTTGIGWNIAIPHCYYEIEENTIVLVGISFNGIDFKSIDNKPVKIILLDIVNKDFVFLHKEYLQKISMLLSVEDNRELLINSMDSDDFLESIKLIEKNY